MRFKSCHPPRNHSKAAHWHIHTLHTLTHRVTHPNNPSACLKIAVGKNHRPHDWTWIRPLWFEINYQLVWFPQLEPIRWKIVAISTRYTLSNLFNSSRSYGCTHVVTRTRVNEIAGLYKNSGELLRGNRKRDRQTDREGGKKFSGSGSRRSEKTRPTDDRDVPHWSETFLVKHFHLHARTRTHTHSHTYTHDASYANVYMQVTEWITTR